MTAAVRNAAVATSVIIAALLEGRKAGKSMKEIAESLGMNTGTLSVRVTKLRKRFAEDAAAKADKGVAVVNPFVEIDSYRVSRRKNVFDTVDLQAKFDAVDNDESSEPEADTEAVAEATAEVPAEATA